MSAITSVELLILAITLKLRIGKSKNIIETLFATIAGG